MVSKETGQRIEQVEESANEWDEQQCIQTFLNWYNKRFKTSFSYYRAEGVFPKIADSTRWDFIITQKEHSTWYAVEIKRLIRPEAKIQLVRWNKLLKSITNSLRNRLQGEFHVYGVPCLKLDKQKRTKLKRVLAELILQSAQSLKNGETIDLGAQILRRFREWPSTPHLNPNLSPPIEHRVNVDSCFSLQRISDTGCSLELLFAQSGVFIVKQVVEEALTTLFDSEEMLQANKQLGLAKQKGAKETILLLDYHLPSWYPNCLRQVMVNNMNSQQLSNIDTTYIVKVYQNRVSKIWGTSGNLLASTSYSN